MYTESNALCVIHQRCVKSVTYMDNAWRIKSNYQINREDELKEAKLSGRKQQS